MSRRTPKAAALLKKSRQEAVVPQDVEIDEEVERLSPQRNARRDRRVPIAVPPTDEEDGSDEDFPTPPTPKRTPRNPFTSRDDQADEEEPEAEPEEEPEAEPEEEAPPKRAWRLRKPKIVADEAEEPPTPKRTPTPRPFELPEEPPTPKKAGRVFGTPEEDLTAPKKAGRMFGVPEEEKKTPEDASKKSPQKFELPEDKNNKVVLTMKTKKNGKTMESPALPVSAVNVSVGAPIFPTASYKATVILTPETPEESRSSSYDRLRRGLLGHYAAPLDGTQYQNKYNLEWVNGQAIQRVYQTITVLKRDPDFLTPKCGGNARWETVSALGGPGHYHSVMVNDSHEFKLLPYDHVSSVTLTLKMSLTPKEEKHLRAVSSEVSYDPSSQRIRVSSDYLGGCIATAAAVKLVKQGAMSADEARSKNDEWLKVLKAEWDSDDDDKPITKELESYILAED